MDASIMLALPLLCALTCAAPARAEEGKTMNVRGESLVLVKTQPARLCFDKVVPGSVKVRSTFSARKQGVVVYEEGVDYVVDYDKGTIKRTASSRVPDWSTNCLYGQKDFDHSKFAGFSNHGWFIWVDYRTTNGRPWAQPNDQTSQMARVRAKLEAGGRFRIASYGDSITAGGEASEPRYRFQNRYAAYLRRMFPKAQVTVTDVSISGYSSREGIDWFDRYLGTVDDPDLVLVGFGMNDHNINGPTPETFRANLVALVNLIRERKGADVILFSAFPPNDLWHYGRHMMGQMAQATKEAAQEANCAYVDVWSTWKMVLERKDQPSLLGNNINHPNDFGHWMYEQAFEAMVF